MYEWDQELDEIHVWFPLPAPLTRSDVEVRVSGRQIVIRRGEDAVVDGELLHGVDVSSVWWVVNGETVDVYATKGSNEWWESLLVGSASVDVQSLAEERHADIGMLDAEAREVVEKMMHQQRD